MKMNLLSVTMVLGALISVAGVPAFASDKWLGQRGDNWEEHIQSTKTRAQVIAELNDAHAQGLLSQGEDPHYPREVAVQSTRSREEVRREAAAAAQDRSRDSLYSGS